MIRIHKKLKMLNILTCALLLICFSPAVLCAYQYPGYPGVDYPSAREEMLKNAAGDWMIPKCNKDGSFQEMQCFDEQGPDDCMCVYKDGTPLTLARRGDNITSCLCPVLSLERYLIDDDFRILVCDKSGCFNPLLCSMKTHKCWCVTKYGNEVAPPSSSRRSCDDIRHLLEN